MCFELRYCNQFLVTQAILDKGLLGDLHYGEIDYYHGVGPWYGQYRWNVKKSMGGSSLLSADCHALDMLIGMMGGEVTEVTSYATQSKHKYFKKYEYPTTCVTILKFRDGRVGKTASVWIASNPTTSTPTWWAVRGLCSITSFTPTLSNWIRRNGANYP